MPYSSVTDAKVALCDRVEGLGVELEEVAGAVNQDGGLHGLARPGVVTDAVVGEVVENFEREEPAWFWYKAVPVEDGLVDDLHVLCVAAGFGGFAELRGL